MITCTGKDGSIAEFDYEEIDDWFDDDHTKKHFLIYPKGQNETLEKFDFEVVDLTDEQVMVTMMHNHGSPLYTAKGIPEAMIIHLAEKLGKNVRSSSQLHPTLDPEFRELGATKVWKRLVDQGLAKENTENDYYYLIN